MYRQWPVAALLLLLAYRHSIQRMKSEFSLPSAFSSEFFLVLVVVRFRVADRVKHDSLSLSLSHTPIDIQSPPFSSPAALWICARRAPTATSLKTFVITDTWKSSTVVRLFCFVFRAAALATAATDCRCAAVPSCYTPPMCFAWVLAVCWTLGRVRCSLAGMESIDCLLAQNEKCKVNA